MWVRLKIVDRDTTRNAGAQRCQREDLGVVTDCAPIEVTEDSEVSALLSCSKISTKRPSDAFFEFEIFLFPRMKKGTDLMIDFCQAEVGPE